MGFFTNGMKDGPGVAKNVRKKKGIFLYIDIVFRKFMKLMQTNFLYFLCSLPYLVLVFMFLSSFVMKGFGIDESIRKLAETQAAQNSSFTVDVYEATAGVMMRTIISIILFNFFGSGPVSASYAYITKCFTQGNHAWIVSDGWDKFKENLKQSLPIVIIDFIVIVLAMNAISFYTAFGVESTGMVSTCFRYAKYLTIVLFSIYMFMHIYIYQIMTTYKCTFLELIKFSVVIALAKLPMTFLLSIVNCAVLFVLFNFLNNPFIASLIYSVIGLTFTRYPFEFYAARVIDKNIRAERKKEKKKEATINYID